MYGPGARRRTLDGAASLMGRAGYGARLGAIMRLAGLPAGSAHYYFPAGRDHLVAEVITHRCVTLKAVVARAAADSADVAGFLRALILEHGRELERSDYAYGCALGALTTTGSTPPHLTRAIGQAISSWAESIGEVLQARGVTPTESRTVAGLVVTCTQGAILLSRALRNSTPLEHLSASVPGLVASLGGTASTALGADQADRPATRDDSLSFVIESRFAAGLARAGEGGAVG